MTDLNYFYRRLIKQAEGGERYDALSLLKDFVQFKNAKEVPAPLLAYIQKCISVWLNVDCDPKESAFAFNVQRPAHRDNADHIAYKHIKALRAYYLMRGRRKGREEAVRLAANNVALSESAIKKLLEAPSGGGSTIEQEAALFTFKNIAVKKRCLNPPRKRYQRTH